MIEENRAEFEKAGILAYHQAGILGQGIRIAIFDVTKDDHYAQVMRLRNEAAPLAEIEFFSAGHKKESVNAIIAGNFDIVNCSFSTIVPSADFERLEELDIPVICSAGNNGKGYIAYPARLPWTISVGAWKEHYDAPADYSQQGEEQDCVAFTDMYIQNSRGDKVVSFGGTSSAAPMISYMLALYMCRFGKLKREEARQFIYANCQDRLEPGHDHKSGYGLFVLPELEVPKMRDINLLHPDLQPKAKKIIELCKAKGIEIIISQTMRTQAEQDELYAQGRTKPGQIVTNVKYPNSMHCWGLAFDVAVIISGKASWIAAHFNIVGPIGESLGLEWGGRRQNFPDRPHFQLPGHTVSELIKKYGTPENYKKSWSEPVKEAKNVAGFEGPAKVIFKGKELSAGILEGKTFVELRALAELLGLNVAWDNLTKTVTLK